MANKLDWNASATHGHAKSNGNGHGKGHGDEHGKGHDNGHSDHHAPQASFVFAADDGSHGTEPWVSDGTKAGTHLLLDINPGSDGSGFYFADTPALVRALSLWQENTCD